MRDEYEPLIVERYDFTSAKKMASVLVKRDDSTLRLYNKGAAEWVLKRCVSLHNEYGEVVPMTETVREELMQVRPGVAAEPCGNDCVFDALMLPSIASTSLCFSCACVCS